MWNVARAPERLCVCVCVAFALAVDAIAITGITNDNENDIALNIFQFSIEMKYETKIAANNILSLAAIDITIVRNLLAFAFKFFVDAAFFIAQATARPAIFLLFFCVRSFAVFL